jgi:tRNA(Ile)-lysidine synthase
MKRPENPGRKRGDRKAGKSVAVKNPLALGTLPGRFQKTRPYLVGVSGGIDSVALVEGLRIAGFRDLVICHLDHALRGRAGAADARFVKRLAEAAGFRFFSEKIDVRRLAAERGLSVETAAREARHSFFERAAESAGTRTLFLGHHADDQAETILFNVLRGTGVAGLRGMRPAQRMGGLRMIRPLLGVRRSEIAAFVAERGLRYREDPSNAEAFAARNRIRNGLLPALREAMGRDVVGAILRLSDVAGAEDDFLEALIPVPAVRLRVAELRAMPAALARRLVRRWLVARGVSEVGFEVVEAVRCLAAPDAVVAKVNLARGWHARRREGALFIDHRS